MKDKKNLINFILYLCSVLLVAALPMMAVYVYAANQPATYKESYYAALPIKYDRIQQVEGEKIVVIGGSSVAFGLDSKLVEQELKMPCVNFGLYAAFGLKPMLDLSLDAIGKGDIVVIAPELSSQMFSDYVGYDFLLQACEERSDMAIALGITYAPGLMSKFPTYIEEIQKLQSLGGLKVSGVYTVASFDAYGDMIYEREHNVMDGMYSQDNLPEIKAEIVTDKFAKMVNEYAKKVEAKGAKVYFGFCPVNELSVENISQADRDALVKKLEEKLEFEVIASLDDHIFDAGYFYDSNFHTNDAGTILNTVLLINDLKRVSMDMSVSTNIDIPKPPAGPAGEEVLATGTMDGFHYEITASGVTITGLDDDAMKLDKLEIPEQLENYVVRKIGNKAFAGCSAKEIVLPKTIAVLSAEIFSEAKSLTSVYLMCESLPEVGGNLLTGANENLKIYVPKAWYSNFVTDYFWGVYAERIESGDY